MLNHGDGSASGGYRIDTTKSKRWWYEMGPIRPPSEGRDHSLLIRATRNCPWNRCRFCPVYKGQKFEYRSVAEVKEDIDVARALAGELKAASWRLGLGGRIDRTVLGAMVNGNPGLYVGDSADSGGVELCAGSLVNVANWLASGGRTAFLQDADTLIMRVPELLEVLKHLKGSFPSIERITSYARAKTASRRSPAELKESARRRSVSPAHGPGVRLRPGVAVHGEGRDGGGAHSRGKGGGGGGDIAVGVRHARVGRQEVVGEARAGIGARAERDRSGVHQAEKPGSARIHRCTNRWVVLISDSGRGRNGRGIGFPDRGPGLCSVPCQRPISNLVVGGGGANFR